MNELTVNGKSVVVDVALDMPLLWFLRDTLGLTGTKYGCGIGQCGSCSVLIDGQSMRSCALSIAAVLNKSVTTIEGVAESSSPVKAVAENVQAVWKEESVPQCGYCQPGQIITATALLSSFPDASGEQIDDAMSGNLCRCGTYPRIKKGIQQVQEVLRRG
ncbi:(2Fe-2S)-binding protein [Teredinibacter sp. KSP-S5-2]|uniref:(2Fe-2S)-binding protein n=1 Tax=Teredinibacter sp. KSP-S5-2 TaxID=3034506 RepID=UPI0029348F7D|nr:2Fe-2S iron-sulfur cluster-binding protein [Teredinibacter sp. KSP-S5-2]WNO08514.1 (2Fe-2S)-binding protein [Teredinibacter sp. KSP-S5-2]